MNWLHASIGDLCIPTLQGDPARTGRKTFRYVDISGIDREAKVISQADEVASDAAPSRARKIIEASDVLVSTVRPNLNAIALVPEELSGEIASTGFSVLRPNRELLIPKFLFYWTQNTEFVEFLVANATGASYPAVTDGVVKRANIPLPPPCEQSRIVELLDEADRLRRLRREADAKADRILPALFLKMFGDPATNPMGWKRRPIGELCRVIRGASPRPKGDPRYFGGDIPWIKISDIHASGKYLHKTEEGVTEAGAEKSVLLQEETLILSNSASVGTPCILKVRGCIHDGFLAFLNLSNDIDRDFLYASFLVEKARLSALAPKGIQANLNTGIVKSFEILVPPIESQLQFVRTAALLEEALDRATSAADELGRLWSTMLNQAFSGQLTAKWREAHMQELITEMAHQVKAIQLPSQNDTEALQ